MTNCMLSGSNSPNHLKFAYQKATDANIWEGIYVYSHIPDITLNGMNRVLKMDRCWNKKKTKPPQMMIVMEALETSFSVLEGLPMVYQ